MEENSNEKPSLKVCVGVGGLFPDSCCAVGAPFLKKKHFERTGWLGNVVAVPSTWETK